MASISHAIPKCKRTSIPLPIFFIIKIFYLAALAQAYNNNNNNNNNPKPTQSHFSKFSSISPTLNNQEPSISSACKATPYKLACESLLLSLNTRFPKTPKDLFNLSVHYSLKKVRSALVLASILSTSYHNKAQKTHLASGAMTDCLELFEDSLDQLSNVVNNINYHNNNDKLSRQSYSDIQTGLSAALTNQETCIQSLQGTKIKFEKGGVMISTARNLTHIISNSLAIFVYNYNPKLEESPSGRKLLSENEFPDWVSLSERKLLEASVEEIEADAVVAKDGSGSHESIGEAIMGILASGGGGGRQVIYVKAGIYHENLKFPTKQKNVMLVGDGKDKTVIVGSRNADDGWSTFQSATVAAMGDGFIAKDITFVNSAGPSKHQAVALRVGSDKSVIFRCSIQGYQDSLYTHSKRQFYRETDIYGTIDFIFGNSAVVFQNCNIFARKGAERNFITAQGRTDPNQNTGISIHNCKISSDSSNSKNTYLGRPWQKYSRTVIMQSVLDNSINPSGWYPWSGSFALNTLFYGEYMNSGPGASTSGRVKWAGYHGQLTAAAAQTFTVGSLISGNMWLPSTGVSFDSGLIVD